MKNLALLLIVILSIHVNAQQPATNSVNKNVQVYVDQHTDISDYDKINYSELADKKYKYHNGNNIITEKSHDIQNNNQVPADERASHTNDQNSINVSVHDSNKDQPVETNLTTEKDFTNDLVVPENNLSNSTSNLDQDIKISNEGNDNSNNNHSDITSEKVINSNISPESTSVNDSLSSTNLIVNKGQTVTNDVKPILNNTIQHSIPTVKESVNNRSRPTTIKPIQAAIQEKPSTENKEIIVENKQESIFKNKSVYNENLILEELIKSRKYEVTDDGKYIRIGKKN